LAGISESAPTLAKVESALAELSAVMIAIIGETAVFSHFQSYRTRTAAALRHTLEVLRDPDASLVLELLYGDLDPNHWQAQEALAEAVWPELSRSPVGEHLEFPASN
jgi:hypothetical protein